MTSQITPGPWFLSDKCPTTVVDAEGDLVAIVYGKEKAAWPKELEPNRLAIAAVPAMVEALVAVRPQLEGLTKRGEDRDWRPAEAHLALVNNALKLAGIEP